MNGDLRAEETVAEMATVKKGGGGVKSQATCGRRSDDRRDHRLCSALCLAERVPGRSIACIRRQYFRGNNT
jgi:hypothetical protein